MLDNNAPTEKVVQRHATGDTQLGAMSGVERFVHHVLVPLLKASAPIIISLISVLNHNR